jgi:hypothetical protein
MSLYQWHMPTIMASSIQKVRLNRIVNMIIYEHCTSFFCFLSNNKPLSQEFVVFVFSFHQYIEEYLLFLYFICEHELLLSSDCCCHRYYPCKQCRPRSGATFVSSNHGLHCFLSIQSVYSLIFFAKDNKWSPD